MCIYDVSDMPFGKNSFNVCFSKKDYKHFMALEICFKFVLIFTIHVELSVGHSWAKYIPVYFQFNKQILLNNVLSCVQESTLRLNLEKIYITNKKSINKHKYLQLLQRCECSNHDIKSKSAFTRKNILKRQT